MSSRYTDAAPQVDGVTKAGVVISYEHHEVHSGRSFVISVTDSTIATNAWMGIAFTTPATGRKVHMVAQWATLAEGHAEIIEDAVVTGGAAATPVNRNRSDINASVVTNCKTYNSSDGDAMGGGTNIHTAYAYSSKNAGSEGGRDLEELVLAPDTVYAFKVTGDAAGGTSATLALHWYEHEDSNA